VDWSQNKLYHTLNDTWSTVYEKWR
jgi:hypothetical protein